MIQILTLLPLEFSDVTYMTRMKKTKTIVKMKAKKTLLGKTQHTVQDWDFTYQEWSFSQKSLPTQWHRQYHCSELQGTIHLGIKEDTYIPIPFADFEISELHHYADNPSNYTTILKEESYKGRHEFYDSDVREKKA